MAIGIYDPLSHMGASVDYDRMRYEYERRRAQEHYNHNVQGLANAASLQANPPLVSAITANAIGLYTEPPTPRSKKLLLLKALK